MEAMQHGMRHAAGWQCDRVSAYRAVAFPPAYKAMLEPGRAVPMRRIALPSRQRHKSITTAGPAPAGIEAACACSIAQATTARMPLRKSGVNARACVPIHSKGQLYGPWN